MKNTKKLCAALVEIGTLHGAAVWGEELGRAAYGIFAVEPATNSL